MRFFILFLLVLLYCPKYSLAQDSTGINQVIGLPDKFFSALNKKTSSIEQKLDKQTANYLSRIEKQEHKLKKKLWKKDSTLAKQLFDGVDEKYNQLKTSTGKVNQHASEYSGHLDTITTALNFLKINANGNAALQKSLDQYKELQAKLNATDEVKKFLLQRQELLKGQFGKLGMVKALKAFRKEVYYYQQQVREYRQLLDDPNKLEAKLIALVMNIPAFKSFFADNSVLGSLFALPGGTSSYTIASLAGLQTRAMVNQSLTNRFGSSAAVAQRLQQNVRGAQTQLSQLNDRLNAYKSGSYGNAGVADGSDFKPANTLKTKTFLQRLEYGGDVQSQRANNFFPVTSDLSLSIGYRLNDKSTVALGAAYKLGWGYSWNNIKLSHQGIGLRSYIDWKIKGSIYCSGGYEQNYKTMIHSIDQLKNYSAWQTSGLIGVSKKYSISKKLKGEIKLLWDFMSYNRIPRGQPVLFRMGYSLK